MRAAAGSTDKAVHAHGMSGLLGEHLRLTWSVQSLRQVGGEGSFQPCFHFFMPMPSITIRIMAVMALVDGLAMQTYTQEAILSIKNEAAHDPLRRPPGSESTFIDNSNPAKAHDPLSQPH